MARQTNAWAVLTANANIWKKKARFLLRSICEGVALFGVCLSRMWTRRGVGHGLGHHFCEVKYLGIGNSSSKGAIPSMFTKMQRLVFLDCTNCDTMADDVIGKVAECCPLLELFCLNGCKYVYRWTFLYTFPIVFSVADASSSLYSGTWLPLWVPYGPPHGLPAVFNTRFSIGWWTKHWPSVHGLPQWTTELDDPKIDYT